MKCQSILHHEVEPDGLYLLRMSQKLQHSTLPAFSSTNMFPARKIVTIQTLHTLF